MHITNEIEAGVCGQIMSTCCHDTFWHCRVALTVTARTGADLTCQNLSTQEPRDSGLLGQLGMRFQLHHFKTNTPSLGSKPRDSAHSKKLQGLVCLGHRNPHYTSRFARIVPAQGRAHLLHIVRMIPGSRVLCNPV